MNAIEALLRDVIPDTIENAKDRRIVLEAIQRIAARKGCKDEGKA